MRQDGHEQWPSDKDGKAGNCAEVGYCDREGGGKLKQCREQLADRDNPK